MTDEGLKTVIQRGLTVLPYGPKKIICTYDQSCNLSCPSCRMQLIVEREHAQEILDIQRKLQEEALPEAEYLLMAGAGDPFGSPYFRHWLQDIRLQDMPKLQWIHLHTNGLLWTPKMWGSLAEGVRRLIKSAEISIDAATAETYAVNRRGGDFGKLLKNLEFISRLRQEGPLTFVKISMVVQANNFEEMPAFVRLGQRFGFDQVYFSQLVNWGTFSDQELARRAVHVPTHPLYRRFVAVLQDKIFDDRIVNLGNLASFRRTAGRSLGRELGRMTRKIWKKCRALLN